MKKNQRPIPAEIAVLMYLVNSVGETSLPVIDDDDPKLIEDQLKEIIDPLRPEVRDYIRNGATINRSKELADGITSIEYALHRYNEIRLGRQRLHGLAKDCENPGAAKPRIFVRPARLEVIRVIPKESKPRRNIGLEVDLPPQYEICVTHESSLLDAINNCEARIRKCEACGKFYWAGRSDSRCSTACGNLIRQQKKRQRDRKLIRN
jgi:hypothetical protein